jgi:hypothetical protein
LVLADLGSLLNAYLTISDLSWLMKFHLVCYSPRLCLLHKLDALWII